MRQRGKEGTGSLRSAVGDTGSTSGWGVGWLPGAGACYPRARLLLSMASR